MMGIIHGRPGGTLWVGSLSENHCLIDELVSELELVTNVIVLIEFDKKLGKRLSFH